MKVKNHCLNLWKGAAAFAVILIHCPLPGAPGRMVEAVARFAVPLFFLISGYFACDRDTGVIRRRAVHIFRLYVGAVAVYYLWAAAQYALSQHTFVGMAAKLFPEGGRTVPELLLWNRTAMAPHLWFMGALVYCYLFDMVLVRTRREEKAYWLIPVILAANLLLGEGRGVIGVAVPVRWIRSFWLTGLPFFLWGSWFARQAKREKLVLHTGWHVAIVAAGMLLTVMECRMTDYRELYLGSILTAGGLFALALTSPDFGKGAVLTRIGERDSAQMYLWHLLLRKMAAVIFRTVGLYGTTACQMLTPFLVGVASVALAELINVFTKKEV